MTNICSLFFHSKIVYSLVWPTELSLSKFTLSSTDGVSNIMGRFEVRVHKSYEMVTYGEILSVLRSTCFISETTKQISLKSSTGSIHCESVWAMNFQSVSLWCNKYLLRILRTSNLNFCLIILFKIRFVQKSVGVYIHI